MNWLVEPTESLASAPCIPLAIMGCLETMLCRSLCALECDFCVIFIYEHQ
jgi:hypothetical protein